MHISRIILDQKMHRCMIFICLFIIHILEADDSSNVNCLSKASSIFDDSDRAKQLHLRQTFRDLKIRRQMKVADVGAGGGWLTVRLATFIGPKGRVYAVDIFPGFISYIEGTIKSHQLKNVVPILGSATDPNLPENTLDAVMILIAYHEFTKPITMLTKIRRAMKIGARLGIIERDTDQMRNKAREAYEKTGFITDRVNETLSDHFLVKEHVIALDIIIHEVTSVGFKYLFSRELAHDYYSAIFVKSS